MSCALGQRMRSKRKFKVSKGAASVDRSNVMSDILLYISCRDCRHDCHHTLKDGRNGGRELVKEQSRTGETSESDVREGG